MFPKIAVPLAVLITLLLSAGPASAAVVEGKVVSVDDSEYEIIIQTKTGDEKEYDVDDNCQITLDGKTAKLDDIEEGDLVKLTTKSQKGKEVVVKIEAKSAQ